MVGHWIGTSGWSYDGWRGRFYPRPMRKTQWLGHYAQTFNSVEINASFYRLPKPPVLEFDAGKQYFWNIETNHGSIKVRLLPETAPVHASSTMYLSRAGFYDDLTFHRVIPGFMAQGGDPTGTGMGGPGYKYASEIDTRVRHSKPGLLSMANTGRPRSDGSQFFLTFVPTPHLDGKHTIFGEVSSGMDVLRALEACGSQDGTPTEPLKIERTWIEVKPAAPK